MSVIDAARLRASVLKLLRQHELNFELRTKPFNCRLDTPHAGDYS